jgi:hypothetical protein
MSTTLTVDLPIDVVSEAQENEDFPIRLGQFVLSEVVRRRKRKSPHRQQAEEMVKLALADAERIKAQGVPREDLMNEFSLLYENILEKISSHHVESRP